MPFDDIASNHIAVTPVRRWRCGQSGRSLFALVFILLAADMTGQEAFAQPPGTRPPAANRVVAPDPTRAPVDAFLYLDETGARVVEPNMTWEEIDRLRRLEQGISQTSRSYVLRSLRIDGIVRGTRAELSLRLEFQIESAVSATAAGSSNAVVRPATIDLGLKNFHQTEDQESIRGVQRGWVEVTDQGYQLQVFGQPGKLASLDLKMVATVQRRPTAGLKFDLPKVPTVISLTIDQADITGSVMASRDDVVNVRSEGDSQSLLQVEGSGGELELQWNSVQEEVVAAPLIEVDSRVDMRWDSPDQSPTVLSKMELSDRRGELSSFAVNMPSDSQTLDTPTVDARDVTVTVVRRDDDPTRETILVDVPDDLRLSQLTLEIDYQLNNRQANATRPLALSLPQLQANASHSGQIRLETSKSFRLRWQRQPWVGSILGDSSNDVGERKSYYFRFDRGSFRLPIWLSAKQQQLRVESESIIKLGSSVPQLDMIVSPRGQSSDGRGIRLQMGDWSIRSITDMDQNLDMESFLVDDQDQIEVLSEGDDELTDFRVRAVWNGKPSVTNANVDSVNLGLPRVIEADESILVQSNTIEVRSQGDRFLNVDLDQSKNLQRSLVDGNGKKLDGAVTRFDVFPPGAAASLVGQMVEQPQRLTLVGQASVELQEDDSQSRVIQTELRWQLTSRFDLGGVLVVRMPRPLTSEATSDGLEASIDSLKQDNELDLQALPATEPSTATDTWTATVDGVLATLEQVNDREFRLVSERLSGRAASEDPIEIVWQSNRTFGTQTRQVVALPYPVADDVVLSGAFPIRLAGDELHSLLFDDDLSGDQREFDSLPNTPLPIRLKPIAGSESSLEVSQVVLRTAIGSSTRSDEVIATVSGARRFTIRLQGAVSGELSGAASVDGLEVPIQRQRDALWIELRDDGQPHTVRLQAWVGIDPTASMASIRPLFRLPINAGRVYWQIVVPSDTHPISASPSLERAMTWTPRGLLLVRQPTKDSESLADYAGLSSLDELSPGNEYLFIGTDVPSFRIQTASRGLLWGVIAGIVLFVSTMLTYVPRSRSPLTAVLATVLMAGLAVWSADMVVIFGQVGLVAMLLVAVMFALRSILSQPGRRGRSVLTPSIIEPSRRRPSTRSVAIPAAALPAGSKPAGSKRPGSKPAVAVDQVIEPTVSIQQPGDAVLPEDVGTANLPPAPSSRMTS
ncbi:MAG: hypothetical protein AAGA03_03165 [Planctomycetota bacterium]